MNKDLDELANRVKKQWPEDAHRVHEAASVEYRAEVIKRAELGAALAAARKAQLLTQPALSELTGIQQAEISRIERGVGNPTAQTLIRLAEALGHELTITQVTR